MRVLGRLTNRARRTDRDVEGCCKLTKLKVEQVVIVVVTSDTVI